MSHITHSAYFCIFSHPLAPSSPHYKRGAERPMRNPSPHLPQPCYLHEAHHLPELAAGQPLPRLQRSSTVPLPPTSIAPPPPNSFPIANSTTSTPASTTNADTGLSHQLDAGQSPPQRHRCEVGHRSFPPFFVAI